MEIKWSASPSTVPLPSSLDSAGSRRPTDACRRSGCSIRSVWPFPCFSRCPRHCRSRTLFHKVQYVVLIDRECHAKPLETRDRYNESSQKEKDRIDFLGHRRIRWLHFVPHYPFTRNHQSVHRERTFMPRRYFLWIMSRCLSRSLIERTLIFTTC